MRHKAGFGTRASMYLTQEVLTPMARRKMKQAWHLV